LVSTGFYTQTKRGMKKQIATENIHKCISQLIFKLVVYHCWC